MSRGISEALIQLRAIAVFTWLYGWKAVEREPFWLASSLLMPISIIFIMTIFGGSRLMAFGMVGGLAMAMGTSGGLTVIGDAAFLRLELKFQSMLVNTKLNPATYTIGLALSELTYSIPGLALFAALVAVIVKPPPYAYAYGLLALILEWVSLSMMGYTISTYITDARFGWSMSGILDFALGTLPPVFYPATLLPTPWLTLVSPISAASTVMQYYMLGVRYPQALIEASYLVLAIEALVFTTIAVKRSRWCGLPK